MTGKGSFTFRDIKSAVLYVYKERDAHLIRNDF